MWGGESECVCGGGGRVGQKSVLGESGARERMRVCGKKGAKESVCVCSGGESFARERECGVRECFG